MLTAAVDEFDTLDADEDRGRSPSVPLHGSEFFRFQSWWERENSISRWWQLKCFCTFHPCSTEDEPILTGIFFKGVGSTTN